MADKEDKSMTFEMAKDRYKQTLEFNNSLFLEEFPRRYQFNTEMQITKKRYLGANEAAIEKYKERRNKEYPAKLEKYRKTLENGVPDALRKYANNIKAAFGAADYI